MTIDEKNKVIKEKPEYGKIICRCEEVTLGEIIYAINQNPKAKDLDGIKRRTRATMGRCQGGFCMPSLIEILAKDLNIPYDSVTKRTINKEPQVSKNIQTKNAEQKLEDLKQQIINCKKCELGKQRLNAVCGSGDSYADIMFVGEGPGFQEDHKGQPFIGRAGDLLTKIIEAMGYKRETVYFANIVKCHPMKNPENPELKGNDRPPTPEEMQQCQPYLDEQIKIISPKVIITLGASSTRAL